MSNWRQVQTDVGTILINMDNVETIEPIAFNKKDLEYHMASGEMHVVKGNFKATAEEIITKSVILAYDPYEQNPHGFPESHYGQPETKEQRKNYMDGSPL